MVSSTPATLLALLPSFRRFGLAARVPGNRDFLNDLRPKVGMIIIPYSIILLNTVIQVHERIAKYLLADEIVPVHAEDSTSVAITMQDVEVVFEGPRQATEDETKSGEKEKKEDGLLLRVEPKAQHLAPDSSFTLSIGTLTIERGTLTGVIGPVGSGKSVWINLLLGSQRLSKGKITCETFVGYAPQEPFVASGTIMENIVFGRNFDEAELKEAIRLAAFERDVSLLSDGINTVLGERGTTLSGGELLCLIVSVLLEMNSLCEAEYSPNCRPASAPASRPGILWVAKLTYLGFILCCRGRVRGSTDV